MDPRVRHGIRGAVFVYTEILFGRLVAFVIPILLIRNLPRGDYGVYLLIPSILLVVAYLTGFGLEDVVMRFMPEYRKQGENRRVARLLGVVAFTRIAVTTAVLVLAWVMRARVADLLNAPPVFESLFAYILLFMGVSRVTALAGDAFVSACGLRHYVSVVRMGVEVIRVVLFCAVIWMGGGIAGIVIAMLTYRVVELVAYVAIDVARLTGTSGDDLSSPLSAEARRLTRFAGLSFLSRGFHGFRNLMADNLVIAYFMSPLAVAGYGVASFFPNAMRSLAPSRMLSAVVLPMMVESYVKGGDTQFVRTIFGFLQKLNLFLLLPMAAGSLVLADEIITYVLQPEYLDALSVVYVLVLPTLFTCLTDPFMLICEVIERKGIVAVASLFAIYNLVMDVILVPVYGIMGAAVATASASVLTYLYVWIMFRYAVRIDLPFPFRAALRITVNTVVMAVATALVSRWVGSFVGVFLAVGFGVVVYAASSWVNKSFSDRERQIINEASGRHWFVF